MLEWTEVLTEAGIGLGIASPCGWTLFEKVAHL